MSTSRTAIDRRLHEYSGYVEIKQFASKIAALQQEKCFHSLAFLSLYPGEGKTLVCAAAAMAYAESQQAGVLLVDTTTYQNKNSLVLRQCINGFAPLVDIASVDELDVTAARGTDFALLKKSAEERFRKYPLVILDTAPLLSRNRRNMDPFLVAHLCDAAVLVVNPRKFDDRNLRMATKLLQNPSLHLIGMLSNEVRP